MTAAIDQTELKRAAAVWAVGDVQNDMVVGLGTGSAAEFAVKALSKRIAQGLRVVAVPTSERTRALAAQFGVPLAPSGEMATHRSRH
jgi:ribose 5-phosphate isomerase A